MEKNKLRKVGLTALEWLEQHPEIKQHKESSLYEQLSASQQWQQAQTIGIIRSLPLELSTQSIFERVVQEGKQVVVPRTFKGGRMYPYQVFPEAVYDTNIFGVEEPPLTAAEIIAIAIDLLTMSGIVFNRADYRVDFGGGFYDRYLEHFPGHSCSLVSSEQLHKQWQPEAFDQPIRQLFIQ